jgi:hypothetical protein
MAARVRARIAIMGLAVLAALALAGTALAGHGLDHPAPSFAPSARPSPSFQSGGSGARWRMVATMPTGNFHTDLDFFTHGGETYVVVGTSSFGPNGGGQTIVRLTDGDRVRPRYVSAHPSATCIINPESIQLLQHDVEATPKGDVIFSSRNPFAVRDDAQLILDATDDLGRCHDQGVLGLENVPRGGLEIVDVTDPADPVEIGLTSHIGMAHTVNVDPKRPHIAYAVTSDAVAVSRDEGDLDGDGNRRELVRENVDPADGDRFDLDGFEIVDLSSCMGFARGTPVGIKRQRCRPEVYRYRYPRLRMSVGHTVRLGSRAVYGCHELEVYPSDLLTCASGNALLVFDMERAFDDNGTPRDFSDDVPRGRPLPCRVRPSSSLPTFDTGAMITDCVDGLGPGTEDLTVARWLGRRAPRVRGVRWLGSIHHQGRGAGGEFTPAFDSAHDIDFDHEAELSASGNLIIASDERGGGFEPPGASCSPVVDIEQGNGGLHAYRFDRLTRRFPRTTRQAFRPYARRPGGGKAIYRAPIRTGAQADFCTVHVFHQIPGQNRIFMSWYTQGTQVVDFAERRRGRVRFKEAGYFIPASANEWVSAVFDMRRNGDGTFTYWGVAGDFNFGTAGRNAIDVWEATLPPPPRPARLKESACRNGGWRYRMTLGGRPFAGRGACLRYARR